MKRYILLLTCLLSMFSVYPAVGATSSEYVTLIYKEYDKPVKDVGLWLFFYDETKKTWVNKGLKTNQNGAVGLSIPLRKDKKSYVFWFALDKKTMFAKMKAIKGKTDDGLRVVKSSARPFLEISLEKGKFGYKVKSGQFVAGFF